MLLRQFIQSESFLKKGDNYFVQKGFEADDFEKSYLSIRKKESRIYSDDQVAKLPYAPKNDVYAREWKIRAHSADKLLKNLIQRQPEMVLEVGCGNGWLSNFLATGLNCEVCGLDINNSELLQGSRVFKDTAGLTFLYGNIFDDILPVAKFDVIVLAGVVQYFPNVQMLIERLLILLKDGGEVHFIDSPIYPSKTEARGAKERTENYFQQLGEEANYYYHHSIDDLDPFNTEVLYSPDKVQGKIIRKFLQLPSSPFIWIKIVKSG